MSYLHSTLEAWLTVLGEPLLCTPYKLSKLRKFYIFQYDTARYRNRDSGERA